jgi:hypothetical protein
MRFLDYCTVEASTDGVEWAGLINISGTNSEWQLRTVSLAAYAGQPSVRIRFHLLSVGSADGWYLDDVTVGGYREGGVPEDPRSPTNLTVSDVSGDQGRQVRLRWQASQYDAPAQPVPITGYAIFREQGANKCGDAVSKVAAGATDPAPTVLRMEGWDYLATVPACGDITYQYVAPTLCDSTVVDGICWSWFFIRAMTPVPTDYYDSVWMQGYSADNLAPLAPRAVVVVYDLAGNRLNWEQSTEADFDYYKIYRGNSQDFVPDVGNLVAATVLRIWLDPLGTGPYFYKVTAVDFAGNESAPGAPSPATDVPWTESPRCLALYTGLPNPFNPVTTIRYDLPVSGRVCLDVNDARGRRVRLLVDEERPAGRYEARWDGADEEGRQLASGVYFCRIVSGDQTRTRSLALVR